MSNKTYFLDGTLLIGSTLKHMNADKEGRILDFYPATNEYLIQYNKNGTTKISEQQLLKYWIRTSEPDADWEDFS